MLLFVIMTNKKEEETYHSQKSFFQANPCRLLLPVHLAWLLLLLIFVWYCACAIFRKVGMPEAELRLGLWPAVEEFLAAHQNEWVLQQRYTNNNGLAVLKRINKNAKKVKISPTPPL